MKNIHATLSLMFAFLAITLGLNSCKREVIAIEESVKDVTGTWVIKKATRNATDLTNSLDFSQFRIQFNTDSTYTIENLMPFIVSKNGSYSLDDPQYPFKITFNEMNASVPEQTAFNYPTVNGVRQMILTFSPGCESNIYEYTLEKLP